MHRVTLITVGTLKEAYLAEAASEYRKRLAAFCDLREVNLPEERIADEDDPRAVAAALNREGEKILAALPQSTPLVALCVEGKQLSSEEFADAVGRFGDSGGTLAFVIGSSHGLSPAVKEKAALKLSYSKMTFPHQLMRVVFLESLYRAYSIRTGKRYHK